jgi:hypothetical protein
MRGAISPLPQYAFMVWSLIKAQGQLIRRKVNPHIQGENQNYFNFVMKTNILVSNKVMDIV